MLARVQTFALNGLHAFPVDVEADIRSGLPAFTVVGLGDKAVREARDRVKAAMVNSGFVFPLARITVNLAPASRRKIGPSFDLPIAMAVLVASGQVAPESVAGCAFVGELSLGGEVAAVRGVLSLAEAARAHGVERLVVPFTRTTEAALVPEIAVVGVASLQEAVDVIDGRSEPRPIPPPRALAADVADPPDLADVRGHAGLMPGIELAAAGGHNLFMVGPPGTGKTMLARRLPSILPPLTPVEALEITRIQSAAGLHAGGALVCSRPFRAPHHTISASGLVGGGASPLPGEVTLGHRGVVFLDELSEFARPSLEALRQPLEDGYVTVIRAQQVETFPSAFMLVAASNPCPCGRGDDPSCTCSAADTARHDRRLSGPLLDRMDVMLNVGRPTAAAMRDQPGPSSAEVRERVTAARERQTARLAPVGLVCNAQLTTRLLRTASGITSAAWDLLYALHDRQGLSGRGQTRVLRVARTLADLDASDVVLPEHVGEAAGWRLQLAAGPGMLAA